ncbi:HAMP domain-containing sensor histidine kinase [uncultured Oscillibacter sp.]|uniref:sensor histidine kinase n=1 Tax=uncultured Oscillibacter sp. TaxID=876091 RepID=UPI002600E3E7|nr:HAMP domain-containing sensor histidine kinase [uncultured Oscillibacter sp.]
METGTLCLAALAAALLALLLWNRRRTRRLLLRLDEMLDRAIRGEFREEAFDESLLSAVETKLAYYLSASAVSARNLQEEKDKIKALISDISHQTKTPIANVLLYTQLLEERDPDCGEYTAALGSQARKLQSLIEALVKTSRLETGMLAFRPRPGPLAPVLEEAVAQFGPAATQKGLALTLKVREETAVFDAKWTEEAVCNLIDNAVKYTPSGGRVTVSAQAYELFARVDVADTGPGLSEEELTEVFRRFWRGPGASETEGVGVGLYLVRQIAGGQGGYVRVFSRPGHGAKFSLFLPRG